MLVEDDASVAQTIAEALALDGYQVRRAATAAEARVLLDEAVPDLIILDLMLPDTDGLVLCSTLKARADVPIIICSASSERRDRILGLKLGADDFIAKPFDLDELQARVEAVLRRSTHSRPAAGPAASTEVDQYQIGDLTVDRHRRRVTLGGQELQLTPTEYRLLGALVTHADEVLSREELAQAVWGYQDASIGRAIDAHVRRLRVKLNAGPAPAPPIVSVRGFGYKIANETASPGATSAA
jgi:DNA-binding response OmpR family regulator